LLVKNRQAGVALVRVHDIAGASRRLYTGRFELSVPDPALHLQALV
jgi:hypothetical protein